MKTLKYLTIPVAIALLATSCSSDETSQNGVPSPEAGAGGRTGGASGAGGHAGSFAGHAGRSGGGAGGTAPGSAGASGGAPADLGGAAGTAAAAAGAAGEDAGSGEAGAPNVVPFDGSCATLPGTVVYIESGDTQENLLKNLGRHLRDTADITLAFNLAGSCTLTSDMFGASKIVKNGTLKYIPSTAEDAAWTPSMPEPTCTTGADGVSIDLAISALFVESCGLGAPPAGLDLVQGPIQAYTFIVPIASTQNAIWAEEAYYAFGFGSQNPLAPTYDPWNDEGFLFIRAATKSTLVATAKNVALPPNKWKGVVEPASSDVVTAVSSSTQPEATRGILGAEVYDGNRSTGIKTLAFQAFSQNAAYYPDSTSSTFDNQNVRDGHYTLWSPTVYLTPVDSHHVPTNPAVKYISDLVLGNAVTKAPSGGAAFDGLADVVKVGLIPECAMSVTRNVDGGDLSPFSPDTSCACYYLSRIPGASGVPSGCTVCTSDQQCGGGVCSHGFCEPDTISTAGSSVSGCFAGTPTTHAELINACTNAQGIEKTVVLPAGGLRPLP